MAASARTSLVIKWSGYVLLGMGFLSLGYVGLDMLDAGLYQAAQSRQFQRQLNNLKASDGNAGDFHRADQSDVGESDKKGVILGIAARRDAALGRIEIGSIRLAAMILEGTDARTLRQAVGHIPGTPLPGQQGNVVITGHRDTFFRPLRNIHRDDEITLTTLNGAYRYRVDSTEVVEPEDTRVLADSGDAALTLVTCYPFYYVGPAPRRFVVHAHMVPR